MELVKIVVTTLLALIIFFTMVFWNIRKDIALDGFIKVFFSLAIVFISIMIVGKPTPSINHGLWLHDGVYVARYGANHVYLVVDDGYYIYKDPYRFHTEMHGRLIKDVDGPYEDVYYMLPEDQFYLMVKHENYIISAPNMAYSDVLNFSKVADIKNMRNFES